MPVSTTRSGGAVVVSLKAGGLDAATALHGELEHAVGSGRRRVVVDLCPAPPLDLTVVGVLLAGLRRLHDADGQLVLLAPTVGAPLVADDGLELGHYFRVEHSLPEAIAATAEHDA
jgi:anti-anti-sigma regulatory factor